MLTAVVQARNAARILPLCVANLLHQGMDIVLVADHGSTDGTDAWLAATARSDPRVQWTRNADPGFHQADALTALARVAVAAGATWVLPVDADELWVAADLTSTLREVLGRHPDASALEVVTEDFPPPTDLEDFGRDDLRRFGHRFAPSPNDTVTEADIAALAAGEHAYLPHASRTKVIARADPELDIAAGSHAVSGLPAGPVRLTDDIRLLHLPLRDRRHLEEKRRHGERLRASGFPAYHGWHTQMLTALSSDGDLQRLWRANSVGPDGRLPSGRACDELVTDDVLARLADRLADPPPPAGTVPPSLVRGHLLGVTQRLVGEQRRATAQRVALEATLRATEARSAGHAIRADRLEAELAQRVDELEAMRDSRSWRLTRPLRRLAGSPDGAGAVAARGIDTTWAEAVVDHDWYLETYPDVRAAGLDPVEHYAVHGREQGRLPRPSEDLPGYSGTAVDEEIAEVSNPSGNVTRPPR